MRKQVRFLKGISPYQAGEVAGLDSATVSRLLGMGVVELVGDDGEVEKDKKSPEVDKMVKGSETKKKKTARRKKKKKEEEVIVIDEDDVPDSLINDNE